MESVLLSWVGNTDLRAPEQTDEVGLGPIAQVLEMREYDEAQLLTDYEFDRVQPYIEWLRGRVANRIQVTCEPLSGPTEFGEIYEAAVRACLSAKKGRGELSMTFHLSPGTPDMASVWIILAKTRFPAELIESSRQHGVRTASVPFDISADFIPDLIRGQDEQLRRLSTGPPPEAPEFADILHRTRAMARVIERARRVAVRNVPVLIEGETGTGKELLARAIHRASPRLTQPFVAVNWGSIPAEFFESDFSAPKRGLSQGPTSLGTATSRPPTMARVSR